MARLHLVPVAPRGRRRFGALKGKISIDKRFPEALPDSEADGWNLSGDFGSDVGGS